MQHGREIKDALRIASIGAGGLMFASWVMGVSGAVGRDCGGESNEPFCAASTILSETFVSPVGGVAL